MAGEASPRQRLTSVLVVVAAFLAGAGTGAGVYASFARPAHQPPPPGHAPGKRLPPFLASLDLSAEQRTRLEAVVEKYHARFEEVFEASAPRLRALREEMDAEVLPILTEAQRARVAELKKQRPEGGPGFGPPPGPGRPPPGPPH